MSNAYTISQDGKSITCFRCGRTSHHPVDVNQKYCDYCHVFHEVESSNMVVMINNHSECVSREVALELFRLRRAVKLAKDALNTDRL